MPATRPERKARTRKVIAIDQSKAMVWRGPDYPVLEPGRYTVRGMKVQGPVWVRSFRRWSVRVEFALTTEPMLLSAFFNLGNNQERPDIGRQSRYYKAWVLANGEHPKKGEAMTADIFLEGQFFEVQVESCNRDAEGKPKPDAEAYSRITQILSMHRV